jgi:ABC-2 type transport system permease protein
MITNIWTIARRDFRSYFSSPIAYIVIAAFMVIMGWMFFNIFIYFKMQGMQFQGQMGKPPSITDGIVRPLYGNMNVVLLMLIPFITMRVFAEEKKLHTIELLITSPITLTEIVLGKFFAAFHFLCIMVGLTLIYPAVLMMTGNPDLGPIFTSALGTLLMASCYIAIGTFFSALTENQIVAGALTFMAILFFWLVSWASQTAGPVWSEVLNHLSLISHYNNFSQGTLNTTDIFYYLSFIFLGLFLTHRVLDSYRWR